MRSSRAAAAGGLLVLAVAAATVAPATPGGEAPRLGDGETVLVARSVAGWPWPEMPASRGVAATPAEVMAVCADFGGQAPWVPRVVARRVGARPGPGRLRVAYGYETPGPDERYVVDVRVVRDGKVWEARWEPVQTWYARRLSARLDIAPHPAGALVTYVTRVDPGPLGVALGSPVTAARRWVPDHPVRILTVHAQGYKFAPA